MKKFILPAMAFSFLMSGTAIVSAESEQVSSHKKEFRMMSIENFQENVHKANQLKIEQLELKKQIVQKRDKLFDLHIKANKNGTTSKRMGKSAFRQDMKKIHEDLRALRKEAHENKQAMRDAMQAKDTKLASEKMKQLLSINEQINNKLKEKSAKLDEIIAQHQ